MNYLVDRESIVFRTAAGTKLAGVVGSRVAFEVDGYDASTGDAWSVVIKGTGHELLDLFQVRDALDLPLDTWHAAPNPRFVRIKPDTVSGRRFTRPIPSPRAP